MKMCKTVKLLKCRLSSRSFCLEYSLVPDLIFYSKSSSMNVSYQLRHKRHKSNDHRYLSDVGKQCCHRQRHYFFMQPRFLKKMGDLSLMMMKIGVMFLIYLLSANGGLFLCFTSFSNHKSNITRKSLDVVSFDRTRGRRIAGPEGPTELRRLPYVFIYFLAPNFVSATCI